MWLFPETDPLHEEEESPAHFLRYLRYTGRAGANFSPTQTPPIERKPMPTAATFPDATTVRLPFSNAQNSRMERFVAWELDTQPFEDDDGGLVLSLREATAVAHNMAKRLHLSVCVHASFYQAARLVALASSFSAASINFVIMRLSVEDMHEDDEAHGAHIGAMYALRDALRADTRGFIKKFDARWLRINNAVAESLAGAIASIASCGLRCLDLDQNEMDDEGAASVVRILMDRASRHIPLLVSMRHQNKPLSAAGCAAMMDAAAADAGANLQLRL